MKKILLVALFSFLSFGFSKPMFVVDGGYLMRAIPLAGTIKIVNKSSDMICFSLKRGGTFERNSNGTYSRVGDPVQATFEQLAPGDFFEEITALYGITLRTWKIKNPLEADKARLYHERGSLRARSPVELGAFAVILSPEQSASLNTITITDDGFDYTFNDCGICLDSLYQPIETKKITVLSCGHAFCTECITQCFESRAPSAHNCPICRKAIGERLPAALDNAFHLASPEAAIWR